MLTNDDLLTNIFAFLDARTVGLVRLVSRCFEVAASPFLFSTLRLGFRVRYLRRLRRVAADKRFAPGVREIVWDTATYVGHGRCYTVDDVCDLRYLSGHTAPTMRDNPDRVVSEIKLVLARWNAMMTDEQALVDASCDFMQELAGHLRAFTGLKSLDITTWSSADRRFFDKDAATGRSTLMPCPLRTLSGLIHNSLFEGEAFMMILSTLSRSGRLLRRFSMASSGRHVALGPIASKLFRAAFPGMVFGGDGFMVSKPAALPRLARPLRHLKELRLDFDDQHMKGSSLRTFNQKGGLRDFLAQLTELETMSLRMLSTEATDGMYHMAHIPFSLIFGNTIFRALRELRLSDLWTEPPELCELFSRHASTLEDIALVGMNLGDTARTHTLYPGTLLEEGGGARSTFPEWEAVAKTCQAMPKLAGLSLEMPSVGATSELLGFFDVEDIMERAMDGLPNRLAPRPFTDLWE